MNRPNRLLLCLLMLLLMAGCANLQPRLETPKVSITSFRLLPSESMAPRFEVGLHVMNPNLIPLALKGMSYNIKLEGHPLISGVTSDLPLIAAYGEGDIVVQATTDLFSGLKLVSELMARPRESFTYELEAKFDMGGLLPNIRVRESGEIDLQQGSH